MTSNKKGVNKYVFLKLKNNGWYNLGIKADTKYYALNTNYGAIIGDHDFVITVVTDIFAMNYNLWWIQTKIG